MGLYHGCGPTPNSGSFPPHPYICALHLSVLTFLEHQGGEANAFLNPGFALQECAPMGAIATPCLKKGFSLLSTKISFDKKSFSVILFQKESPAKYSDTFEKNCSMLLSKKYVFFKLFFCIFKNKKIVFEKTGFHMLGVIFQNFRRLRRHFV